MSAAPDDNIGTRIRRDDLVKRIKNCGLPDSVATPKERDLLVASVRGDLATINAFCDTATDPPQVERIFPDFLSLSHGKISILELAIHCAIRADQGQSLALLLDRSGISPDKTVWRYDRLREDNAVLEPAYFLHAAAERGAASCLRVLLDRGANISSKAFGNFTALCYATNPIISDMLNAEPQRREGLKVAQEEGRRLQQEKQARRDRLDQIDRIVPRNPRLKPR